MASKYNFNRCNKYSVFSFILLLSFFSNVSAVTPALLPHVKEVPPTHTMSLDGVWLIKSIGKKVRIESGRAYAVDPWVHLFTLQIMPGMVVIKNIHSIHPGKYSGDDLPLLGKWDAQIQADRTLAVSVAGALGPVQYIMEPVQLDKEARYQKEMVIAGIKPNPPAVQPPSDDNEIIVPPPKEQEKKKQKIEAIDHGPYACKGKDIYLSKGSCYQCPTGFTRFSPTRKMTHEKACTKRQPGKNLYTRAIYINEFSLSCPKKSQFKHKGHCKSCPRGYEKEMTAPEMSTGIRFNTGYCLAQ